ncbi:hypothetical protein IWQ60_000134 [Tieghemiomyces parasiticus]|uniref:RRM domain-containing protein n=1 Tax=Tieghemiomyces parasiticus TaxID=78921 RepID=A0A9W8AMS0_9FUNG|nr:hypothetical protein IWQ60_000134 [Tieghemiomyces parasiticus]
MLFRRFATALTTPAAAVSQRVALFSTSRLSPLAHRSIYVGNIAWRSEEEQLRELFESFGGVVKCHMPKDPMGRVKGVAFVDMATDEAADSAIEKLNGYNFLGRDLRVSYSINERRYNPNNFEQRSPRFGEASGQQPSARYANYNADQQASSNSSAPASEGYQVFEETTTETAYPEDTSAPNSQGKQ